MINPLSLAAHEIEDIKTAVAIAVKIAIYREDAQVALSRLATLDTTNAVAYTDAARTVESIGTTT